MNIVSKLAKIGKNVSIGPFCIIENAVVIEDDVIIGPYTHIMANSIIGPHCHLEGCYIEGAVINAGSRIYRNAHIMMHTVIGDNCLIGGGCFIADGAKIGNRVRMMLNAGIGRNAIIEDDVYIGPNVVFTNSSPGEELMPIRIGEGAFVGSNVVTTPGVSIGAHSIVGTGSVVTKDVPPSSVVVGNPARVIRWRVPHVG